MTDAQRRAVAERLRWTELQLIISERYADGALILGKNPAGQTDAFPWLDANDWAGVGLLLDWLAAQRTEDGGPRYEAIVKCHDGRWEAEVWDRERRLGEWHPAPTGPAAVLAAFLAAVGEA